MVLRIKEKTRLVDKQREICVEDAPEEPLQDEQRKESDRFKMTYKLDDMRIKFLAGMNGGRPKQAVDNSCERPESEPGHQRPTRRPLRWHAQE